MTSLILAGLLAAAIAWLLVREGRHRAEIRRRDRELGEARRDAGPGRPVRSTKSLRMISQVSLPADASISACQ